VRQQTICDQHIKDFCRHWSTRLRPVLEACVGRVE
jgi:hypothetical protein